MLFLLVLAQDMGLLESTGIFSLALQYIPIPSILYFTELLHDLRHCQSIDSKDCVDRGKLMRKPMRRLDSEAICTLRPRNNRVQLTTSSGSRNTVRIHNVRWTIY